MSNTPNSGLYHGANNSNSTLRPRASRLISYIEDEDNYAIDSSKKTTSTSTSNLKRTTSTTVHAKSTTEPAVRGYERSNGQASSGSGGSDGQRGTSNTNGIWESWSQLQGIASTILGSDTSSPTAASAISRPTTFKTPLWMKQDRGSGSAKSTPKWGPKMPDRIGVGSGSIEERQAMIQAKKRETLLMAASQEKRDASGRFKRKGSSGSLTVQSPILDSSDALVYRHKVLPSDTMAGVAIKFNCQPEIFRKVNRLWPNDRIQIREYVLLPVDACSIRGKKIGDSSSLELLEQEHPGMKDTYLDAGIERSSPLHMNDSRLHKDHTASSSVIEDQDDDFKHDSWVNLPNFPKPVEILRIPRTTLGYFPPARRKSNHHLLTSGVDSTTSSPRNSFDTLRHPPSHAAQQAQLHQQNLQNLDNNSVKPPRSRVSTMSSTTSHQRSFSVTTATSQQANSANSTFFSALRGPGGVGTLRGLRSESSRPGPAVDALNQNAARYLPALHLPVMTNEDDDFNYSSGPLRVSSQSLALPRSSIDSARSNRSGRSNSSTSAFGTGVENWVKKIATATSTRPSMNRTISERTMALSGKNPLGIGGETGLGDLIELETSTESMSIIGEGEGGRQSQSTVQDGEETPRIGQSDFPGSSKRRLQTDDLLNERFPVGGKITRAYGNDVN